MMFHVENFMRGNNIKLEDYSPEQCGYCIIDVVGNKTRGRLKVSLSLTRQEAIDLLKGLGFKLLNENAGAIK